MVTGRLNVGLLTDNCCGAKCLVNLVLVNCGHRRDDIWCVEGYLWLSEGYTSGALVINLGYGELIFGNNNFHDQLGLTKQ